MPVESEHFTVDAYAEDGHRQVVVTCTSGAGVFPGGELVLDVAGPLEPSAADVGSLLAALEWWHAECVAPWADAELWNGTAIVGPWGLFPTLPTVFKYT